MPRSARGRLLDILEAIQRIDRHSGSGLGDVESDDPRWEAVLYNFVVLGEAARYVPDDIRSRAPDVDWNGASGMRNVVAHEYFAVRRAIILRTIENELPALREAVEGIVRDLDTG